MGGRTRAVGWLVGALAVACVAWTAGGGARPLAAQGGWSGDPAANLALADRPGDQVQVKLEPAGDDGYYASWLDDATGGYDVTLQRLDAGGRELWQHNGILVADTSFDWTTDYGLDVDADGDALLAFRDDRGGGDHLTVNRVSPEGTLLWGGANGIQLDASADFLGPPKIVSTSDDEVVVAWTHGNDIRVRRLDLAGQAVWPADVVFTDPSGATQLLADAQPCPDGGVVVSWVHTASFYEPRHLWAERLSPDGAPLWGPADPTSGERQPLVVFDSGTLQYGNFPPFVSDGADGAVFAWYETDPLQVRVQHVLADGSSAFPANGLLTTSEPDTSVQRSEPDMAYDVAAGDIYVFWRETHDSGPLDQWLVGQRFAADGSRLWGDMGRQIEGHGAHEVTQLQAAAVGGRALFAYAEQPEDGAQRLWIQALDPDGTSLWTPAKVAVSTAQSAKMRLEMVADADMAVLGWEDARAGNQDIYVQNVNPDGSLGPAGPVPTLTQGPSPTATGVPTAGPTAEPTEATVAPTYEPTEPTVEPTSEPTIEPTAEPAGQRLYLPLARRGG